MTLLCFDVDGTLDCSNGPVSVTRLNEWHDDPEGPNVVIVSPSGAYVGHLPRCSDKPTRRECLNAAARMVGVQDQDLLLYVSDNKDYEEAHAAGFCYIEAAEFAKGMQRP